MDPEDKRLAIQVDDHPLAYKDFAGRIPEGEYGAGLVEIWDKGTFVVDGGASGREEADKRMAAALKKGHLDFILQGRKLQGLFTLVRIKSREGDKDNQWLLMKRKGAPGRFRRRRAVRPDVLSRGDGPQGRRQAPVPG